MYWISTPGLKNPPLPRKGERAQLQVILSPTMLAVMEWVGLPMDASMACRQASSQPVFSIKMGLLIGHAGAQMVPMSELHWMCPFMFRINSRAWPHFNTVGCERKSRWQGKDWNRAYCGLAANLPQRRCGQFGTEALHVGHVPQLYQRPPNSPGVAGSTQILLCSGMAFKPLDK